MNDNFIKRIRYLVTRMWFAVLESVFRQRRIAARATLTCISYDVWSIVAEQMIKQIQDAENRRASLSWPDYLDGEFTLNRYKWMSNGWMDYDWPEVTKLRLLSKDICMSLEDIQGLSDKKKMAKIMPFIIPYRSLTTKVCESSTFFTLFKQKWFIDPNLAAMTKPNDSCNQFQ